VIIFNLIGVAMLGACFAVAFAVGALVGNKNEDVLMIVAGPLLFVCDMLYRRKHGPNPSSSVAARPEPAHWWYHHRRGGQLLFIPIWAFGLFWMLLGTLRLLA
jgi:hypothetical protein